MNKFFGGFGLNDDISLFSHIFDTYSINLNSYDVCGFSFGAQKALSYALDYKFRINRLILLSPAFFNDRDHSFVKSQIHKMNKNPSLYLDYFYKNIGLDPNLYNFKSNATSGDLQILLSYRFDPQHLDILCSKGIEILIFLGDGDKIINVYKAKDFFVSYGIIYFIKGANHLLMENI